MAGVELSFEEKKSLDELIRHAWAEDIQEQAVDAVAKGEGLDKDEVAKQQITVIASASKNETKEPLIVLGSKLWAGHMVIDYSNPIPKVGAFAQSALPAKLGIKAAVVYSGKNQAVVECGWLLAWADTKALGKKVIMLNKRFYLNSLYYLCFSSIAANEYFIQNILHGRGSH